MNSYPETIALNQFTPLSKPQEINIKGKSYLVIANRYDGFGMEIYVYIEQPSGVLKVLLWQDNHSSAEPIIFDLTATINPGSI